MTYVAREIEDTLKRLIQSSSEHKNVILVDGARQVGKSCLVEHVLESIHTEKIEINLEVNAVLRSKIDECRQFSEFNDLLVDEFKLDQHKKTIIYIDEAQESLKLGGFVRSMKEEWAHVTTILTGSSLSRLFSADIRFPVGRVTNITVYPFSFAEYLCAAGRSGYTTQMRDGTPEISGTRHESLLRHMDTFLLIGGLPEIVLDSLQGVDFSTIHRQMMASYEQDFLRLFGRDRYHIVRECLRNVANSVGFPSKLSSVAADPTTKMINEVKYVFSRLEEWNMVLKSPQFGSTATSSHNYLPKRYMFDTGMLRYLRETAVPSINVIKTLDSASRTPLGGIIENQTAVDLLSMGYVPTSSTSLTPTSLTVNPRSLAAHS